MKTKKILVKILVYILVAAFVASAVIMVIRRRKVKLYSDEGIVGNTSCNLLNGGLFSETNGKIYFSNPYDQGKLYVMNNDLTEPEKLYNDKVSYINAAGKYIFYTRRNDLLKNDGDALLSLSTTGLFRLNTSGKNPAKLYDEPTQVACLYGNNVYYQHYDRKKGLQLYSSKIDGSTEKELLKEAAAPYAIYNNKIYYTGWDKDHYIHSISIDGTERQVIYEGNCAFLTRQGDYLYFMNMDDNYSLCRIGLDGGSVDTIIRQRLATYNVSEDGHTVFYQVDDGENNGLYKYDLSNGYQTLISSGNYNFLHLTTNYLIYETYDQSSMYTYNLVSGDVKPLQIPKE